MDRHLYREPSEEEVDSVLASLYGIVGCLTQLEELTIPITHRMGVTEWADEDVDYSEEEHEAVNPHGQGNSLHDTNDALVQNGGQVIETSGEDATRIRVGSLTNLRALRKLTMESTSGRFRLPWVLVDLQPLASSANLTELCIMAYSPIMPAEPFVHVRTLKTCMPLPPNTAADFALAFPNLNHLAFILPSGRWQVKSSLDVEKLRMVNARRWNVTPQSKRWTSLETVWTEDNLILYSLALPEHIPSIYIGELVWLGRGTRKAPLVLAQTCPTLLHMQMDAFDLIMDLKYHVTGLRDIARHGNDSIRYLIVNLVECLALADFTEGLMDALRPALAKLTKLTHILFKIEVAPAEQSEYRRYVDHSDSFVRGTFAP